MRRFVYSLMLASILSLFSSLIAHAHTVGSTDLNSDYRVDIFDYNLLVGEFGHTGSAIQHNADINHNGMVDIFDYNLLVADFGRTIPYAAATYYVARNNGSGCDDTWPGTEEQPRCTIQAGINLLINPNTVLVIKEGTYDPFVVLNKNGTENGGYVIAAHADERVEINGDAPITLRNSSYVTIRGFHVTGATANYGAGIRITQGSNNNVIENNQVYENNGTTVSGILVEDSSANTVINNDVHHNTRNGIWIVAHDITTANNVIRGNKSYRNTGDSDNADGIAMSGSYTQYTVIEYNIVYENGDDGIDTWDSHHQTIRRNTSYRNGLGGDGNGFKLGGTSTGGNNMVVQNIAYDNTRAGFDSNHSGNNTYINNVAFSNGYIGFQDGEGKLAPCTVETCRTTYINNISYENGAYNFSASAYTAVSHNNIFYMDSGGSAHVAYNGRGYSSLFEFYLASGSRLDNPSAGPLSSHQTQPRFVAPATGNFTLSSDSPAINAGDPANPGNVTAIGVPDIGAKEFGN